MTVDIRPMTIADYDEVLRLDPENQEHAALRARVFLADGQLTEALATLDSVHLDGRAQAEVEYLKGLALQTQQRWEAALAAFARAAELDGGEVEYLLATAQAWLQCGQPEQARDALLLRQDQFGWLDTYQATLAECYEQLGDWPAAAAAWQRVTPPDDHAGLLRERAAEALYRAGRSSEAAPALEELINRGTPQTVEPWRLMLAECYLDTGRPAAAEQQAQAVLQVNGRHPQALRLLARCLARTNDLDGALRVAQQAAALDEQDVRSLELVTALAWRTGQCELATATAMRLLVCDPESRVARAVIARAPCAVG